jgi:putative membrane protein (TIGR04086 family)
MRRIHWGRVVIAAVAAEAAVILLIVGISAIKPEFGESAGYYVAPPASAVATFLMVSWVARKLKSDFILHGTLVGLAGVVLTAGFMFKAKPEDRLMYGVSFVLRIIGGYLGGIVARRRWQATRR